MPAHEDARALGYRAESPLANFLLFWWVVPRVQYDLDDVDYQLYTFELFHRDWRTRAIHYVTIPGIAFFVMALLADVMVGPISGAIAYAAILSAIHLRWCSRRGLFALGLVTAAVLALGCVAADAYAQWAASRPSAHPLVWIYALSLAETLSHAWEPIPPPANPERRWLRLAEFVRRGGPSRWALLASVPTLHTIVSFVSNVHLVPTVVAQVMFAAGYRRDLVDRVRATLDAELAQGAPNIRIFPGRNGARASGVQSRMATRVRRLRTVLGSIALLFCACAVVCGGPSCPSSSPLPVEAVRTEVMGLDEEHDALVLEGGEHELRAVFEVNLHAGDWIAVSAHPHEDGVVEIRLERTFSTAPLTRCLERARFDVTVGGLAPGPHVVVVRQGDREVKRGRVDVHGATDLLARAGGRAHTFQFGC
jgi:hypothetical protein